MRKRAGIPIPTYFESDRDRIFASTDWGLMSKRLTLFAWLKGNEETGDPPPLRSDDVEGLTEAHVDDALRAIGADPEEIARRGRENAARLMAKRQGEPFVMASEPPGRRRH